MSIFALQCEVQKNHNKIYSVDYLFYSYDMKEQLLDREHRIKVVKSIRKVCDLIVKLHVLREL